MRLADLQVNYRDRIVIAAVLGEIDMSNATDLHTAVIDATSNEALGVVLDLSETHYVDSAGIHMLYRLGESLRNRGQTLRVVIPPESTASDALRLAGVKRHVDVVDHVEDAVRAVAGARAADE